MLATAQACRTLDAGRSGLPTRQSNKLYRSCTTCCPSPACARGNCLGTRACTLGYSSHVCVLCLGPLWGAAGGTQDARRWHAASCRAAIAARGARLGMLPAPGPGRRTHDAGRPGRARPSALRGGARPARPHRRAGTPKTPGRRLWGPPRPCPGNSGCRCSSTARAGANPRGSRACARWQRPGAPEGQAQNTMLMSMMMATTRTTTATYYSCHHCNSCQPRLLPP